MNAPLPPNLVSGWVIDDVLDERPHSVVVAARGAEPVTLPTQPRFATIVITRPGHEEDAEREHRSLVTVGVITDADIIESTIVIWDGHGVAARVLRSGTAYTTVPASDPLPLSDAPDFGAGLPKPERLPLHDRIDALNARHSARHSSWAMVVVVAVAVMFATWAVLAERSPHIGAAAPSVDHLGVVVWDPVTATMSVERDGRLLTFRLGEPGDEALLGDWQGNGDRSPAIYRPSTGEVWLFTEWANYDRASSPKIAARTLAHGRAVLEAKNGRDMVTVYPVDAPAVP